MSGQESYYSKNYTTDHGLPHNHVRSLAQDSTGFLWIATWDGLSRYDGYEFKNYYHNPADSTSLGYFICEKVLVDFQNNVWAMGPSAISKYNRETDNFDQFNFGLVGGISLDRNGKIWCSTSEGFKYWDYLKNCFQPYEFDVDERLKKAIDLHPIGLGFDNTNTLFLFATINQNLAIYSVQKMHDNSLKAELSGFINNRLMPNIINLAWDYRFFTTTENEKYIYGNIHLLKLDTITKQFIPVEANKLDSKDKDLQKIISHQVYYSNKHLSPEMNQRLKPLTNETYLIDNQNTLWQVFLSEGSNQTGLTQTIETPKNFKHYFTSLNPSAGLNAFFPVLKDKHGNVWAGPANINAIFVHKPDGTETTVKPVDDETWKLASQRPRSFLEDSTGFWIGYFQRLLIRFNEKKNSFEIEIVNKSNTESNDSLFSFIHLKRHGDKLLITGYKEIDLYHPDSKKVELKKPDRIDERYNFFSIAKDNDNSWWIGGNLRMLFHLDSAFHFISSFEVTRNLFNIEDIVTGNNNDLWLSLLGGGLVHFDKITGKIIKVYTTADGLSNNTCYGMLKDKNGSLWISTNKGISKFNPKTEQFRTFGKMEGQEIEEFNSDNTFLAPDGEMFFAGMGGVVSFYPDSIEESLQTQKIQPLVFTNFKISGINRYFSKAVYECDTVQLQKGDDNFQLSFACLDFRNAEKVKYRFRLLPQEKEFTQVDYQHRTINYSGLSPGTYELEVEATNENGEWTNTRKLAIHIPPYFYQTLWFRLLVFLCVAGLGVYLIYSYNHRLRLEARRKQDELKLERLRSQMNPHFIFNALNSINYFISQNDRLSANRYISDFSRLIRAFLFNLSADYVPLQREIELLNDYLQLEHLRFSDKFDYELQYDPQLADAEIFVLPGMVQPFIENAIWHGVRGLTDRKGKIVVELIFTEKHRLQCRVADDGIGRTLAEQRKSNLPGKTSRGIGIVLERLDIINQMKKENYRVTINDLHPGKEETGTLVTIDIPVK